MSIVTQIKFVWGTINLHQVEKITVKVASILWGFTRVRGDTRRGICGPSKTRWKTELSFRTYSKSARAKKDPSQSQDGAGNTDSTNIVYMDLFFICMKIMLLTFWKLYPSSLFHQDGTILLQMFRLLQNIINIIGDLLLL